MIDLKGTKTCADCRNFEWTGSGAGRCPLHPGVDLRPDATCERYTYEPLFDGKFMSAFYRREWKHDL